MKSRCWAQRSLSIDVHQQTFARTPYRRIVTKTSDDGLRVAKEIARFLRTCLVQRRLHNAFASLSSRRLSSFRSSKTTTGDNVPNINVASATHWRRTPNISDVLHRHVHTACCPRMRCQFIATAENRSTLVFSPVQAAQAGTSNDRYWSSTPTSFCA
jgi:hypothetical protein